MVNFPKVKKTALEFKNKFKNKIRKIQIFKLFKAFGKMGKKMVLENKFPKIKFFEVFGKMTKKRVEVTYR